MQRLFLLFSLFSLSAGLSAQLIVTDPAAPTDDQSVTIIFDATQGTGGLVDCGCDVYLHTGVITSNSSGSSDWQYVQTEWGVENDAWKLAPVDGEPNKYTYTYGPSIREYFSVPAGEEIQQVAFVFRNGNGSLEGKGSGGSDIFVDVTAGGALGLTVAGDPGEATWPLGKPLSLLAGATRAATIEIFDNDVLVNSVTGTELMTDVIFTESGPHTVKIVATVGDESVVDSFSLDAALVVEFTTPSDELLSGTAGENITLGGTAYLAVDQLTIVNDLGQVFSATDESSFSLTPTLPNEGVVTYTVTAEYQGETANDRVTFVTGPAETAEPPAGLRPGAVEMPNGDVTLQLRAPGKSDIFVIGNFNDWTPTAASRMKQSSNDTTFWLTITGLDPDEDLIYQYLIDGDNRQPDPYATLVLDPFNDQFIPEATFADLPDYPSAASGILTWHRRGGAPYVWQTGDEYQRPDPKKMVVYELLVRDFLEDHSYSSLTDSLDYLQRLGVNTIELMPISEFEGNISWGYNVSYHMALDKYYGTPEAFKAFVDACHARGMAVVLDVVYNHAFGQSSLVRMWGNDNNQPTADNPYLNVEARHPFNVGYDFNHESPLTQEYVKTTLQYWIEEFRVDGFRFDLSKGFTQNFSNDVGAWNRYDADRVRIIKDYADFCWSIDPESYMIMEHLGELREENELATYGNEMYFWTGAGLHDEYLEASMGYTNNLRGILATNNGFDGLNQMSYMESHDEERMQWKNQEFGATTTEYNVQERATGLDRVALASTFFYTVPGPKMLWQFGELGYDFPINWCANGTENTGCRTDPKPIRWDYRDDSDRQDTYDWIADLLFLRNNYDFFHGQVTRQDLSGPGKVLHLRGNDGQVAIVGNFGVEALSVNNPFPAAGEWYDYGNDNTETITDAATPLTLAPGEFRLYLDQRIQRNTDNNIGTSANDRAVARLGLNVFPNPTAGPLRVRFDLARAGSLSVDLLDVSGRQLDRLFSGSRAAGEQTLDLTVDVPAGLYFLRVSDGLGAAVRRVVIR
ncbi:MAG: alpha-amylase family glycosyl hydrolase [Bacteroidota bacterium]